MRDQIRTNRNRAGPHAVDVIRRVNNMWYNPKTPEQLEQARENRIRKEAEARAIRGVCHVSIYLSIHPSVRPSVHASHVLQPPEHVAVPRMPISI